MVYEVFYIRTVEGKEGLEILGPFYMGVCENMDEVEDLIKRRSEETSGNIIEAIVWNEGNYDKAKSQAFKKLYRISDNMTRAESLNRPRNASAESGDALTCPRCKRTFRKKFALTNHLRHCQQENKASYKCTACGRSFTKPYALTNHKRYCRPDKKQEFKCTVCGKICTTNYGLSNHKRWCGK